MGLTQGTRYYVRVRASKDSVTGGYRSNTTGSVPGLATDYTELQSMINQIATSGTVYLSASGTFDVNATLNILGGKTVTLVPHNGTTADSGTATMKRVSGFNNELINVNAGGTLNLRSGNTSGGSLIIDGGAVWTDTGTNAGYMDEAEITGIKTATTSAVAVSGTMTMYNGAVIQNNYNSNSGAGGANTGGGVRILAGGNFIMAGGTIQQNRAANGGGVAINPASGTTLTYFTMTSGSITKNLAVTNYGGGIISLDYCTGVLSGGSISYNSLSFTGTTAGSGWHATSPNGIHCDFSGVETMNITDNINPNRSGGGSLQFNTNLTDGL
jgi:hypothetical protein